MSVRRYFSAETEAQAVLEAAGHFGVSPVELNYQPVNKRHGLLRRPRVVIEVDPGHPTRPPAPASPPVVSAVSPPDSSRARAPRQEEHPRATHRNAGDDSEAWATLPTLIRDDGAAGIRAAVRAVVELSGLRVEVGDPSSRGAGEHAEVVVDLRGPGRPSLVAHDAEVLRSCEYLVRRMIREQGEIVSLDSDGYRADRLETLRRRAAAAAAEVRRSGEPVLFEPLSAADRRVLHLAIQDEGDVASESEGEGERKRVRVVLRGSEPSS